MVLWWKAGGQFSEDSSSNSSVFIFDGTKDVCCFSFYFEKLVMVAKEYEEKAMKLLAHLDGAAFDFYYDSFARDSVLISEA